MVKITNGLVTFDVTSGAFKSVFKKQGFRKFEDNGQMTMDEVAEGAAGDEVSEDETFVADLTEKPISQWNKEEVKKFAQIKGIDISGTKNVNEAKERIKNVIYA